MHFLKSLSGIFLFSLLLISCSDENKDNKESEAPARILVDETFRPVIEEQFKVFDSSFPEIRYQAFYKREAACINDFLNDSASLILITRTLNAEEEAYCAQKKIVPTTLEIAKDAIAVVVHNSSKDTMLTLSQLRGMLSGRYPGKYTLVFDHAGSSTLRYIQDSLLRGDTLDTKNVFSAGSNDSVLSYVARNPESFGFVGVSYTADYEDPEGLAFTKTVKIAAIYNDNMEKYYQPYQAYIAPDWYPLTRKLYYIHRETTPGPGTGFANFLSRERGQLIFKQSRLFPLRTNIIFREAGVNTQGIQ
jgi:phosphate transport system substrate-binding protein